MTTLKKIYLFCLVILVTISPGSYTIAQRFPVRTYTEADGLANSMIFDLKQDSAGIIWIARRSGISSYDGINFKNYNVADGLKPTSYSQLFIDSKNYLWALVESGELTVSKFTGKQFKTVSTLLVPPSVSYRSYSAFLIVYRNNEPVILVGSEKEGLFACQGGRWRQFSITDGLVGNNVNGIVEYGGNVIVATNKGLSVFRNNSLDNYHITIPPELSKRILAMATDGHALWLLGENWLGVYTNGKLAVSARGFVLPTERNGRQCFMQTDGNERIYFGNLFKAYCFDIQTGVLELMTRNSGLISEGGSSVLIDREHNTWIGGYRGITKIQSRRFASYYATDGLKSNEVASGIEYSPGRYVFGHDGVFTYYDGKTFDTLLLHPSLAHGSNEFRVLDLARDNQGNIWAAVTSAGIARVNKNRKVTFFRTEQGLYGYAFSVISTPGGKIYAGTSTGLFELSGDRFNRVVLPQMHGSSVRKIFTSQGNTLFLTTINWGVMRIRNGMVTHYMSPDNPLANNVFSFLCDSKNRMWAGTLGGLFQVRDTSLVKPALPGLCITRPVYLILEDNAGQLWFGCDNGIYRWNWKSLEHFSTSDGLSGQEINRSAGFIDSRNRIWFGTNNGLTVYDPSFEYKANSLPPPILTLLYVESGNDTLNLSHELKLHYSQNNFIFHFRAISFLDEKQVVYSYKLEGLDTSWSKKTFYLDNSVRYNNLKPGEYRFLVKAGNSMGIWTEPVISGIITIRTPFWFRWWFVLLIIMILGVVGYMSARFVLIARYNSSLEAMVKERTTELEKSEQKLKESNQAKDNFFSIIAHDLKSPFNVILGMLDLLTREYSDYSDEERQNMLMRLKNASTRTIDLLENLLTWARAQRGLLPYTPVKFDILSIINENLLLFESAAHSKDILIKLCGEKKLEVMADYNMINAVVRNMISNAIKFTFPGGTITITAAHYENKNILVSVKDTGIGMSSEIQSNLFKIEKRTVVRGTNNEMGTGLGLILSKDFIEKNGGHIWVESELESGSTFYFTLPLDLSS